MDPDIAFSRGVSQPHPGMPVSLVPHALLWTVSTKGSSWSHSTNPALVESSRSTIPPCRPLSALRVCFLIQNREERAQPGQLYHLKVMCF